MRKSLPIAAAALAASALLSACNSQPETVTAEQVDPTANEIAAAPKVELPPAISASRTYRCKDNSLVYIDFFADNLSANFRATKADAPTHLTASAAGEPFTGEGYTLDGNGETVTLTRPGKPAQSCKA